MELSSPALHADSLLSEPPGTLPRSYMPQLKKKKSQRLIFVSGNHQKYSFKLLGTKINIVKEKHTVEFFT